MSRVAIFRRSSWQALAVLLLAIIGVLAGSVAAAVIRGGGHPTSPSAAAHHLTARTHHRVRTATAPRPHRRRLRAYAVTPQNGPQITFPPAQAGGVDLNPGSVNSSLPPQPGSHFDRKAPGAKYSIPPPGHQQSGPGPVALRFDVVNESGYLARPGLAISSGTIGLSPGSSVSFATGPVKRTGFDGAPVLVRLHLKDGGAAVTFGLAVDAIGSNGAQQQLDHGTMHVSAATARGGPGSSADATLPALSGALPAGDELELIITEPSGLTQPSSVNLYYGALPWQDTGFNQNYQRSQGGPDPGQLTVGVTERRGAFTGE